VCMCMCMCVCVCVYVCMCMCVCVTAVFAVVAAVRCILSLALCSRHISYLHPTPPLHPTHALIPPPPPSTPHPTPPTPPHTNVQYHTTIYPYPYHYPPGNDYLPKLRGVSTMRALAVYGATMKQLPPQERYAYLVDQKRSTYNVNPNP
jgi:hypothetical protein